LQETQQGILKRRHTFFNRGEDNIDGTDADFAGSQPASVHMQNMNVDVCTVAQAMKKKTNRLVTRSSYPLDPVSIPNNYLPHISSYLCSISKEMAKGDYMNLTSTSQEKVNAAFGFKAARTGSTFFTNVLTKTIKQTKRPASMLWEPFCSSACNATSKSESYFEKSLHKLLTEKCVLENKCYDKQSCSMCHPERGCHAPIKHNKYGKHVSITAANPRFFNPAIDWNKVFYRIQGVKLFLIRRTNLVLMSYSKYHHKGIAIDNNTLQAKKGKMFSMKYLLADVEHYSLGNQELSASVAFKASEAAGAQLFPIVYEDVLINHDIVQHELVRYLGLNESKVMSKDIFIQNSFKPKQHTRKFCDNEDVNCKILKAGLKDSYPCLYKQLIREGEGLTWTTPMLQDGSINIRGDCMPLARLSQEHPIRSLSDLYQLLH